jgi:hypothetical protein
MFTFVQIDTTEGPIILNLRQIVAVHDFSGDGATFRMSDGCNFHIHGADKVARIVGYIARETITVNGKPLTELIKDMCAEDQPAI